jgi:hypothetical protein
MSGGSDGLMKLEASQVQEVAEADVDRELFEFKLPKQERGFTDILDLHERGTKLQFVGLTPPPSESIVARASRLLVHTAKLSRTELPMKEIPQIKLIETNERFPLSSVVPRKGPGYLILKRATGVFIPMTSFKDKYTVVKISILDMRHRNQEEKRSIKLNSNLPYNFEFCMDYCFPLASSDKVFLNVNIERAIVNEGEEWGAVQVQLTIEQSTFPYIEPFQETTGAMILPESGLDKFDRDPAHIDLVVTDRHREIMLEKKEQGDIIEIDQIHTVKMARNTYTKSSSSSTSSKPILKSSGGEFGTWNTQFGPAKLPDDQVSIEPEGEYSGSGYASPPPVMSPKTITPEDSEDDEFEALAKAVRNAKLNSRAEMKKMSRDSQSSENSGSSGNSKRQVRFGTNEV